MAEASGPSFRFEVRVGKYVDSVHKAIARAEARAAHLLSWTDSRPRMELRKRHGVKIFAVAVDA